MSDDTVELPTIDSKREPEHLPFHTHDGNKSPRISRLEDKNMSISNQEMRFNNGTVISVKVDKDSMKFYDNSENKIVELDVDGLHGYDTSGNELTRLSPSGLIGYGTLGKALEFYDSSGGTRYGRMGFYEDYSGSDDAFWFESENGSDIYFTPANDMYFAVSNDFFVQAFNDVDLATTNDITIFADSDDSSGGDVFLRGADSGSVNSSGVWIYDHDNSVYQEIVGDGIGTKTAIVQTKQGYNTLYCIESPGVWFMDFVEADTLEEAKKNLDKMFREVTEEPYRWIKAEDGFYQVWGKRKGQSGKRFESKNKNQFDKNNAFWSIPHRDDGELKKKPDIRKKLKNRRFIKGGE